MALWDNLTDRLGGSVTSNLVIGTAVVVLAPIVLPAVLAGLRPLAKTAFKAGIMGYDKAMEMLAEAGEQMSDLVAEARAEMEVSAAANAHARTQPPSSSGATGEPPPHV
jgi:hypothetical protein